MWRRQWHPTPVLLPGKSHGRRSLVGCSPWGRWESDTTEVTSLSLFTFVHWRKEMATHSSILAWRIPGTGEPGGLLSMGSHRVGHNWSNLAAAAATPHEKGPTLLPHFIDAVLKEWAQDHGAMNPDLPLAHHLITTPQPQLSVPGELL